MGSEYIDYWVAYQPDVEQALLDLKKQVVKEESYHWRGDLKPRPKTIEEFTEFDEWLREAFESDDPPWQWDAFETYSILDIDGVSDEPEWGHLRKMTGDELVSFLGTSEPAREAIEKHLRDVHSETFTESLERGQGIFITVYKDGSPDEYYFGFYSND